MPYFNDLDTFFDFGPPVYFVVTGSELPKREGQQQLCAPLYHMSGAIRGEHAGGGAQTT